MRLGECKRIYILVKVFVRFVSGRRISLGIGEPVLSIRTCGPAARNSLDIMIPMMALSILYTFIMTMLLLEGRISLIPTEKHFAPGNPQR